MKDFKLGENPIAVVGMASLMPDAKELSSFWDNIVERLVSIVDVPEDRWSIDDYYDPDPLTPDKTYCKRGAFIPDIEFNPVEYGLPPNILEVTDVSQLLGLVVAKDVLLDAGIKSEEDYDHDRIGITLGIGGGQKLSAALTARLQYPVIDKVLKNAGVPDKERNIVIEKYKKAFVPWEENSFPGLLGNVIAGRIANRFNFGGMNSVVDAACASSLSAMKMAVNELTLGNSDLMITGGSCTDNSIFMYMSFSKTPAFTPAEFIKPFDADSTGMMVGEGVGMIALKRLEDAERDGDRIYALIKGMGSSSDGRFKSIYAPRPEGQAKALKRAYEQAGFEAKTVGLVEAHGTGTAAGDVAEFNSLRSVFSENNDRKQHVALGSVKSQIGHLKAAAGTAGFMKIALALHHKVLPPTASVTTPNPKLAVEDSPFYINAETRPWLPSEDGSPRRAAVSAFGFGGTNFHFVLEEYTREMQGAVRLKHVDHVSIIESSDVDGLIKQCEGLLEKLKEDANPENYQNFIEETRTRKIAENSSRIGFVSRNAGEAIDMLELAINTLAAKKSEQQWELPQGITFRSSGMDCNGKLVALFPGQGSQYLRMGDALAQDYPEFRDGIGKLDTLFVKDGKQKLSDIIYPIASFNAEDKSAQEKTLQLTQNAQPGIGAFSVGSYKLLQQAGLKPDFVAGHSFGELTALWAAGVFSEDDFYFLAKSRGEAMAAPDDEDFDAGSMMAVSGDIPALEESMKDFPDLKIANFNSNAQVVIAGPSDALKEAQGKLKEQGFKLVALPVSAAFHTPLVAHAQKPFADAIEKVKFSKAEIPVYANGTGKVHGSTPAKIKSALKEHILNSVQFRDEIENIYQDGGRVFLEFGPKNVLGKLTENILKDKDIVTISVNPSPTKSADQQMKLMVAKLAVLGVELDEVDKYAAPFVQHATEKPSPLNIKISAAAFVSEKTRKNFSDSLEDGFKLVSNVSAQPATGAVTESAPVAAPAASGVSVQAEINLEDFYQLQNETLKVHEKYLENPAQYMESFQDLLSRISDILDRNPDYELPETISRSLEMFNVQQQETNKVHEQFLKQQAEASQASLKLMNEHYSLLTGGKIDSFASSTGVAQKPVVTRETRVAEEQLQSPAAQTRSEPVDQIIEQPIEAAQGFDIEGLMNEMLEVVAEKTGYPSEMLELDMDMEADLGIDSIKRVEILGSIQEAHPELPELDPEALAELRTLRQIVDYIEAQAPASGAVTGTQSAAQSSSAVGSFDIESLTEEMLSVVAEKTGYPSEMLEMGMDMEADLGIDSIKRVEILGSIQEAHPELPELDPEALAELRTLQQIVDYIEAQAPGAATQITPVQVPANQTSVSLDIEVLTQEMLAVVADKTGYPSEMLELDMDMEADLGIDSIKRVEILGAIQEAHPELPELDPEALAEMRSLRQIVSFIEEQASALNPAGSSGGAGNETAELVSLDEYKQKQNSQQKPSGLSPERAKVVLKELAPAEHLLNTVPEDRACIIVSDGTELTASVVKEYHELSWKVALVNLPGTKAVETGNLATVFELKGFEEEELEQCISDIEEKFGKAACFIFLDASYKATINQALKLDEKRTLAMRHLFLFAKHLKQSLEKNDPGCRNAFITVSHLNGKLGFESGKKSGFDPVSGAPFALCKTLRQEWADVFCRALDIAPSMKAQESAQLIVRENNDANATLVEVGLSGDQRTTLEPEIIEAEPAPGNKSEHNIDQDSVFLVSGGAKGVTAQCVLEIAKSHQCRFILLGRSSISDAEPDWAKNSSDESSLKQAAMSWLKENGEKPTPVAVEKLINPILSQREIGQFLETLEKVGSKAIYLSVDVCDQKAIKKSLEQAQKDVGQITGLIHGAGVLADKFIEQKTIEDFNAVFNTKIAGLASLLKALDPKTIKHLVLFSSAAGFFGNPGQSDYAMANEVLNKFALVFSSHFPDCRVYSFNWGPWDGGMVTPQLKKLFESRGVELISIEGGSKLLNHYLSEKVQENQQILVGSSMEADSVKKKSLKFPDKPIRLKKVLNPLTNVFLDDHAIGKQKVLPMVCSISWHVNTAEACFPGFSIDEVSNASVFNGITFNGNQERTFFQELDNFDYDQDTGRLSMKSSIFSEEGGKRVNHYGAELQLLEKHSGIAGGKECLVGEDVKAIAENKGVSAKQYYENGSLFHGKGLQLIESVLEDNNERLLLKATASSYSEVEQGLFRENGMNHFSMDALLQACLVWVRSHKDMPSLPLKISAIKSYGELSPGQSFFIDLKVVSESSVKMICDITCFNESGELIASLEGAEVTISKSLETKFAS